MEKKIIAIVVALVVVVTAVIVAVVISNNQREYIVDDDGIAHWIYKNEEGSTVLNDKGDIVVYAVDRNGKRQKDENGEYVTAAIDFPEIVTNGNTLETPYYKLTMPKDWELHEKGIFTLKKNDNVSVEVDVLPVEEIDTVDEYLQEHIKTTETFVNEMKKGYPKSTFEVSRATLTKKLLDCRTFTYKFEKDDGTVDFALYNIYFLKDEKIFKISLTCDNETYVEFGKDISLTDIVDLSFIVKD